MFETIQDVIERHMQALCNRRDPKPFPTLMPTEKFFFRTWLVEQKGYNLNPVPAEASQSFIQTQFRTLDSGRGPGMVAVLGF